MQNRPEQTVCQTLRPLTTYFKGLLLRSETLAYLQSYKGSPGADITMCSENTLFTHNVACQAVFTYCLHVPAAVSISALSGELLCLLQRAVNSGVTDLLINGHRLVIRWSLNLSG